jgi:hypothetical protein
VLALLPVGSRKCSCSTFQAADGAVMTSDKGRLQMGGLCISG